jgi:hypothetical protein
MRYAVAWTEIAVLQLARVARSHPDPDEIDREVLVIDHELADDPDLKGDDYYGDRSLLQDEIWALYVVVPDDRIVYILQVGQTGIDLPHESMP